MYLDRAHNLLLYCKGTLTRNSWIYYTVCWFAQ